MLRQRCLGTLAPAMAPHLVKFSVYCPEFGQSMDMQLTRQNVQSYIYFFKMLETWDLIIFGNNERGIS